MQFNDTQLDAVQQFLQAGNLLAYPTEAVWGIGCDPFNEIAVKQILAIKQRPIEKGMIVITGDIAHIQPFLQPLPQQVVNTIATSWQSSDAQATTWLLPIPASLQRKIPEWVTGGRDSLAIRVISHPMIAKLCNHIAHAAIRPLAHDGRLFDQHALPGCAAHDGEKFGRHLDLLARSSIQIQ